MFNLTEVASLYALYSESYLPNGRSDTTDPQSDFFPPEEGQSKEVGLKYASVGGRISGTVSLFEIKRSNARHVGFGGEELQGINTAVLVEEETSQGVEFFGHFNPTDSLSLQLALSHLDARVTGPEISGTPFYGPSDIVGMPLEGVAEDSVSLFGKYSVVDGVLAGLEWGVGVSYRKGPIQQFGTFDRRFIQEKGDILRLDLLFGYRTEIAGHPTRFSLNVQNATDEVYRDRRGQFAEPVRAFFTTRFQF